MTAETAPRSAIELLNRIEAEGKALDLKAPFASVAEIRRSAADIRGWAKEAQRQLLELDDGR